MISEALLLQTPHYALAKTLPLAVPGELTRQNLAFAKAVVLWASPANRRKRRGQPARHLLHWPSCL